MTIAPSARLHSASLLFQILLALALTIGVAGPLAAQQAKPEVLTNEDVISMTAAHLSRDLLIAKINTTKNAFDVSVPGVVRLSESKVNADVMRSMILMAADPKLGSPSKTAEVLDNQSVITMVVARVARQVILVKIQSTKCAFDVSSSGLVNLTQAKVPTDIVKAMVVKSGT